MNLKNLFNSIILSACVMIACLTCEDKPHDPPPPKPITFEKVISLNPEWVHWVAGGQPTSDGGYIIAGNVFDYVTGTTKIFLVKTDAYGEMLWSRLYYYQAPNGVISCLAGSVEQTADGGYIIGGSSITNRNGLGDNDIYLIKTNSNGDTLWTRTYDRTKADGASDVRQTTDGGYIVCGGIAGYTPEFGEGGTQTYIIKTNSVGDTIWAKTFESYFGAFFNANNSRSVAQLKDASFVLTGNSGLGIHLIKLSSAGDVQFFKVYDGNKAGSVYVTEDNHYLIVGNKVPPSSVYPDGYIVKTNVWGDTVWTKTFGGNKGDAISSCTESLDRNYMFSGGTSSYGMGNVDVYIIKTNTEGDSLWTKTFGGSNYDGTATIALTADEGYIIIGGSDSQTANLSVYLIKTDSLGNVYAPDP